MLSVVIAVLAGLLAGAAGYAAWQMVVRRSRHPLRTARFEKLAQGALSLLAIGACFIAGAVTDSLLNPPGPAARVCDDEPFAQAAPHEGSPPHRLAFHTEGGSTTRALGTADLVARWVEELPPAWLAASPEQMQLVACVSEEQVRIEVCTYSGGPNVTRYRRDLTVRLVEARTATVLAQQTFEGDRPRPCRAVEQADLLTIQGDPAPLADVRSWLELFVERAG